MGSKIEELINKYSKSKAEVKKISDICEITRGRVIPKSVLKSNRGDYPVYSSQTLNNGVFGKIGTYDFNGEYVQWTTDGANAGSIFYRNGKFSVTNVCGLLKVKEEYKKTIKVSYLAYILEKIAKEYVNYATSNPKLMSNVMANIKVPLPDIEVQNAMVKILDKWKELTIGLIAELTEERNIRQQQYEYYTKKILKLEHLKEIKYYTLSELNEEMFAGGDLPKEYRKGKKKEKDMPYPIYSNGVEENALYGYTNTYRVDKTAVTIAARGTIGYHTVRYDKFTPIVRLITLIPNSSIITPEFLNYMLYTVTFRENGVGIKQLTIPNIKNIKIPVPSIEEQKKIVSTLDKFNQTTKDITKELSEEIETRKFQYEYYRNKILNFEEIKEKK